MGSGPTERLHGEAWVQEERGARGCLSLREHRGGSPVMNFYELTPTIIKDEWKETGQDESRKYLSWTAGISNETLHCWRDFCIDPTFSILLF